MKLRDVLQGLELRDIVADPDLEIRDVAYDSRRVGPGSLFVAVRGFRTDGHRYIADAAKAGAAAVLCEEPPETDIPYVVTDNARRALALSSMNFFGRPGAEMTLIGVTGTNGKTTTTVLLKHLLERTIGAKVGLIGTNRNMIGDREIPTEHTTPESRDLQALLRRMADEGCTHIVMEVSSHSLALDRVAGLEFAVGVFTNLTQDHLDFHGTMEQYAQTKELMFRQCRTGVINADDAWSERMLAAMGEKPVIRFSTEKTGMGLMARDVRLSASGVRFCALTGNSLERVELGIPGRFSVYNALGVIGCGLQLGLPLVDCCAALRTAQGVKGRVEIVPTGRDFHILIDYAHTPDALENLLSSLREVTRGRLLVLFGCGGDRDRGKRPLMGEIAERCADFVIVTSDNPRTEDPEAIIADILAGMKGKKSGRLVIPDRREAIDRAVRSCRAGDLLVLAGKGHEEYQIVGTEKRHMDERELAAEALARLSAQNDPKIPDRREL